MRISHDASVPFALVAAPERKSNIEDCILRPAPVVVGVVPSVTCMHPTVCGMMRILSSVANPMPWILMVVGWAGFATNLKEPEPCGPLTLSTPTLTQAMQVAA